MSRRRRKNIGAGHRREEGAFLPIPMAFLTSNTYRRLSRSAKVLLLDMGAQYSFTDPNNGQLIATINKLRTKGWRSEVTLFKARRELEEAQVLVETRKGGFPNRATWYAMTFFSLDWHRDYDITHEAYVRGAWRLADGIRPDKTGRLLQKMSSLSSDSASFCSPLPGQTTKSDAIAIAAATPGTSVSVVDSRSSHLPGAPLALLEGGRLVSVHRSDCPIRRAA